MKKSNKIQVKRFIFAFLLLFLTSAGFATNANRVTSSQFTTNSIATISLIHESQLTNHNSQLALAFGVGVSERIVHVHSAETSPFTAHPETFLFFNLTLNTYHLTLRPTAGNLYQYGLSNPLLNVDPEGNVTLGQFLNRQRTLEQIKKEAHQQLVKEFVGTSVENPEQFIKDAKDAKGLDYEGNAIFSRVNHISFIVRKGKDRTHLEVLQLKNYYTVKEGKLTLTLRNVPSRKRHWLDYELAFDNWMETTTEKTGAFAIRTEDRALFRLSDAIIGEAHMPDMLYFGAGANGFAGPLGYGGSTTVNIIREQGHFFPTQLLITGDSTAFTSDKHKLPQLNGLYAPWYASGGLGVMASSGVFAGFGKRMAPNVNLTKELLGASIQNEGGLPHPKMFIGVQQASDRSYKYYNKFGITFGPGGGDARLTPTSLKFYGTNIWYRKFLIPTGGQE